MVDVGVTVFVRYDEPADRWVRAWVSSIEYAEPEDDVCLAGAPARRGICGDPDCVCAPLESHGGRP
jgi:hypothetical protein